MNATSLNKIASDKEMVASKKKKQEEAATSSMPILRRVTGQGDSCCLLALVLMTVAGSGWLGVEAQDLLRRQQQPSISSSTSSPADQNAAALSSLANIQLPPQLAALSPQQLHQLAQLREMQLQQEANAKQQEAAAVSAAPAPIGLEAAQQQPTGGSSGYLSTSRPISTSTSTSTSSGSNGNQIPQPSAADNNNNNKQPSESDESSGAYNESGSELEGVTMSAGGGGDQTNNSAGESGTSSTNSVAPTFEVNWNKCPQLEPSESEKTKKTQVITKCLQAAPIPTNLTRENVEAHREQIATCALKVEGWFDESGAYRYEKAEAEIKGKKLEAPIEIQVLKFHVACRDEANKKFPKEQNKLIDQVQFYQACMDYYISIVCEIEVSVDQ